MNKAKEISALWSQIKPQIGELVRLCHEVESHYEVTADAYQRGYKAGREAEKVRKPDLEQVRKEAYDDGYNAGYGRKIDASYQEGLSDAWEAARTLWNTLNRKEIFGYTMFSTVLTTLTAQEAIEKIRQYEQENENQIQVGDEVKAKDSDGNIGIVTRLYGDGIYVTWNDGTSGFHNKDKFKKTGRHFPEIAEVLRKMKEVDNG